MQGCGVLPRALRSLTRTHPSPCVRACVRARPTLSFCCPVRTHHGFSGSLAHPARLPGGRVQQGDVGPCARARSAWGERERQAGDPRAFFFFCCPRSLSPVSALCARRPSPAARPASCQPGHGACHGLAVPLRSARAMSEDAAPPARPPGCGRGVPVDCALRLSLVLTLSLSPFLCTHTQHSPASTAAPRAPPGRPSRTASSCAWNARASTGAWASTCRSCGEQQSEART